MAAFSVTEKVRGFQYPYQTPDTEQLNIEALVTLADQALIALRFLQTIDQLQKVAAWLAKHQGESHDRQ